MNNKTIISKVLITFAACSLFGGNADIDSLLWQGKSDEAKQQMLEHPDLIDKTNEHGMSPAHIAAHKGDQAILTFLLEHGADVNLTDHYGRPVVCRAIMGNHPDTVALLIKNGAKLDWVDEDGTTPLIYASYHGDPEMIEMLLKHVDAKTIQQANKWNWTPLLHLARQGSVKGSLMLMKKGADVNAKDPEGNTPLILAAKCGAFELMKPMIEAGAELNAVDQTFGRTAYHWAAIHGFGNICSALQEHGIDTEKQDLDGQSGAQYLERYAGMPKWKQKMEVAKAGDAATDPQAVVYYAGHSGWIVKTKHNILVFDYWKPNRAPDHPSLLNGYLTEIDSGNLPVTVFTSHDHQDHYDMKALKTLAGVSDQVTFVYGFNPKQVEMDAKAASCKEGKGEKCDTKLDSKKQMKGEFTRFAAMKPRTEQNINGIDVKTIQSIDTGVGFLATVDGMTFFHPGDHACLSPEDADAYFSEIEWLKGKIKDVDVAFLPVSGCPSRWKIDAVKDGFVKTIEVLAPETVFPMHGLNRELNYKEFAKVAADAGLDATVVCMENPGDFYALACPGDKLAAK